MELLESKILIQRGNSKKKRSTGLKATNISDEVDLNKSSTDDKSKFLPLADAAVEVIVC